MIKQYEVMKPFNTATRRLKPGANAGGMVSADEDFSPFSLDDRVKDGFLREKVETPSPAKAEAPKSDEKPTPDKVT